MSNQMMKIEAGVCYLRSDIPLLSEVDFFSTISNFVEKGGAIVHYFACRETDGLKLVFVGRQENLYCARCNAPDEYPSLTAKNGAFHMFEREIAEQFGIRPIGHPWLKPVRFPKHYTSRKNAFAEIANGDIPGDYPYYKIEGDQVHEVAVGPVHAGIIEPGHFRFNCIGERVLNLEIQLGYQHRGIENLLVHSPLKRHPTIVEGIAGDTTVANSLCYAQAIEGLGSIQNPDELKLTRTLALELERLANHIGDLGALSGDVAYLPPASYYGRIRGEFLNLLMLLSGNRFGKGLIRPGYAPLSFPEGKLQKVQDKCAELTGQINHVGTLLLDSVGVLARFENTGTVTHDNAVKLGLVGVAGRACGIDYDARASYPNEWFVNLNVLPQIEQSGDVWARAQVRMNEINQSLALIAGFPEFAYDDQRASQVGLASDSIIVSLNEAWRGELSHCVLTDGDGKICHYKIKDPSFHNWSGLALALRDEEISDFPLCNKSFNLSYCGFDL
jgi:Ni,Fe-hydrogenase III large subunit